MDWTNIPFTGLAVRSDMQCVTFDGVRVQWSPEVKNCLERKMRARLFKMRVFCRRAGVVPKSCPSGGKMSVSTPLEVRRLVNLGLMLQGAAAALVLRTACDVSWMSCMNYVQALSDELSDYVRGRCDGLLLAA